MKTMRKLGNQEWNEASINIQIPTSKPREYPSTKLQNWTLELWSFSMNQLIRASWLSYRETALTPALTRSRPLARLLRNLWLAPNSFRRFPSGSNLPQERGN